MVRVMIWKMVGVFVVGVLPAVMAGCSTSGSEVSESMVAEMLEEQREQEKLDRQRLAGLEGGLASSLQAPAYAAGADDTLAGLLLDGDTVFSALSAAIHRDFLGTDSGAAHPSLGGAYVKSVGGDGADGLRVVFVVDGRESVVHFRAEETNARAVTVGEAEADLTPYTLFPWTHSFRGDPNDPSTDGSYAYQYFDLKGWSAGSVAWNQIRGFVTYGARTMPGNLSGRADYQGGCRPKSGTQTTPAGTRRQDSSGRCTWQRIWTTQRSKAGSTNSLPNPRAPPGTNPWRMAT